MNIEELKKLKKAKKYSEALIGLLSLSNDERLEVNNEFSFDDLLFNYFSYNKSILNLELELCSKYPVEFVRAIRTSQVFLKEDRLDAISKYNLGDLEIHKEVWVKLNETDKTLWGKIQLNLDKILSSDINEVFVAVIFCLENQRFRDDSKETLFQSASIYSFFMKLYLHETDRSVDFCKSKFEKVFALNLSKDLEKTTQYQSILKLLLSINDWVSFKENTLDAYCFDLNITPVESNGIIYFNQTPKNFYKWQLDGVRYEKNRLSYSLKARGIIQNELKNKARFIPGNTEEMISLNIQGAIREKQNELILEDLALLDVDYFGVKKGLFNSFRSISGYTLNRYDRYELKLSEVSQGSEKWSDAFIKICRFSFEKDIEILPYLLKTKEELSSIYGGVFNDLDKKIIPKSISYLSGSINEKFPFDRFKIGYDVWSKPYLEIDGSYFCPMMFFANNDWFYNQVQLAIKQTDGKRNVKLRKETATKMEALLADKFVNKGFNTKLITDQEASKLNRDGDVDLIITENNTHLLIQLKRTYLRLSPKDAYYESMKSDQKASKQLNEITPFLMQNNDVFKLTGKVKKWIVSTSYEFINTNIDNCNKINYFDLLFALENDELKSLEDIIYHLEKDENLLSFNSSSVYDIGEKGELLNQIGLPIKLEEPNKYLQPTIITKREDINYHNSLDKALSLYGSNDKKAIKLLNQCLYLYRKDIEVYGALGNCYANLKDVDNLITSFEAALKITPNEPYIKRNYALALIENKRYYQGLLLLLELCVDYPLIGDFSMLFVANFGRLKNELKVNENASLELKWKELHN